MDPTFDQLVSASLEVRAKLLAQLRANADLQKKKIEQVVTSFTSLLSPFGVEPVVHGSWTQCIALSNSDCDLSCPEDVDLRKTREALKCQKHKDFHVQDEVSVWRLLVRHAGVSRVVLDVTHKAAYTMEPARKADHVRMSVTAENVKSAILILKLWVRKHADLFQPKDGYPNSYTFLLIFLFFCTHRQNPVVPLITCAVEGTGRDARLRSLPVSRPSTAVSSEDPLVLFHHFLGFLAADLKGMRIAFHYTERQSIPQSLSEEDQVAARACTPNLLAMYCSSTSDYTNSRLGCNYSISSRIPWAGGQEEEALHRVPPGPAPPDSSRTQAGKVPMTSPAPSAQSPTFVPQQRMGGGGGGPGGIVGAPEPLLGGPRFPQGAMGIGHGMVRPTGILGSPGGMAAVNPLVPDGQAGQVDPTQILRTLINNHTNHATGQVDQAAFKAQGQQIFGDNFEKIVRALPQTDLTSPEEEEGVHGGPGGGERPSFVLLQQGGGRGGRQFGWRDDLVWSGGLLGETVSDAPPVSLPQGETEREMERANWRKDLRDSVFWGLEQKEVTGPPLISRVGLPPDEQEEGEGEEEDGVRGGLQECLKASSDVKREFDMQTNSLVKARVQPPLLPTPSSRPSSSSFSSLSQHGRPLSDHRNPFLASRLGGMPHDPPVRHSEEGEGEGQPEHRDDTDSSSSSSKTARVSSHRHPSDPSLERERGGEVEKFPEPPFSPGEEVQI
uniref:Uncharacterized protein n=1 Tax=Chromera velia CCMP2878 TaxID=1169474 RepID=A0A0G4HP71_9ALVE|eukprot:Cvel_7728.t1-p1 / transcript=Cvel_7728.t1 / gene=Cvel_7728 / organism=Chromera_velia_CCMP2878 / gene_product=hypothetical protein / transcript_product=hypothetical protein / location=Cvel_scaffold411:5997-8849(+) / protein_length=723 / sequence_SO=supercontig / SO=protein_coding / is_pseudo=false